MEVIGAAGIPAGAVMDTKELADDPSFEQRRIRQTMQHPTVGPYTMTAWPVRFSGAPPEVKPSPLLGEHSEEVLAGWLGLDRTAIAKLREDAVIGA
jgi:formyl-CoA transferase